MSSFRVNPQVIPQLRQMARQQVDEEVADTNEMLAIFLGVDPATTSRVFRGRQAPGPRFLAGIVRALGWEWLPEIFEVVDEEMI